MTFVLTNPTLSGTIDATEINENFTDVADKINGNILDENISSSANIAVTKLSAYTSEVFVTLNYVFDSTDSTAWTSLSDGDVVAVCPIPGGSTDADWTVTDAMWAANGTGTVAGTFDVKQGYWDSSSVFQTTATVIAEEAIDVPASSGEIASGRATVDSATLAYSSNDEVLVLTRAGTAGTGVLDAAGHYLTVTLRLTRTIQAS